MRFPSDSCIRISGLDQTEGGSNAESADPAGARRRDRPLEGESDRGLLRAFFDRRLKFEFHGSRITSDAGLLAYRELDEALGLTTLAGDVIADSRTGKNGWHGIIGLLRQSVYGRLAGYEDVNDADRLGRDPAMRWIVGGRAVERGGASTSQMGRFETELLATNDNLAALADLLGIWIYTSRGPPHRRKSAEIRRFRRHHTAIARGGVSEYFAVSPYGACRRSAK